MKYLFRYSHPHVKLWKMEISHVFIFHNYRIVTILEKKKKKESWLRTGSSHVGHWASLNALFPNISLKMNCKWYVWLFLDKSELTDAKIHIIKLHIETLVSLFSCVYTQNVYVLNILCCNFDESTKKPYKSTKHQKWTRFHEAKWLNCLSIIWDST